jgi:triacylglycerol lipase
MTAQTVTWVDVAASILNGFWGDYIYHSSNGLAVEMALYDLTQKVSFDGLAEAAPTCSPKVCLLVHGLACNERIWRYRPMGDSALTDYGAQLSDQFDYTPYYLRYNTGLALADNGRRLAALLHALDTAYPVAIEDLVLIGHSMGGLVVRCACAIGLQLEQRWVERVSKIFYLGAPHSGAPLARLSHSAAQMLSATPDPITRFLGAILDRRSVGIKDLRHGAALSAADDDGGQFAPFLASARNYVVAGTLSANPDRLDARWIGDGLVPPPRHGQPEHTAVNGVKLFPGKGHLRLAGDPQVYAQIAQWCSTEMAE